MPSRTITETLCRGANNEVTYAIYKQLWFEQSPTNHASEQRFDSVAMGFRRPRPPAPPLPPTVGGRRPSAAGPAGPAEGSRVVDSSRGPRCPPHPQRRPSAAPPWPPCALAAAATPSPPASQQPRPRSWLRGRPSRGYAPPLRPLPADLLPRAPLSPPSRVSLRPRAAGCTACCSAHPAGGNLWPSRTIFAPPHPHMPPCGVRGRSVGQSGWSWAHGHLPPSPPLLPLPHPTPPTHVNAVYEHNPSQ